MRRTRLTDEQIIGIRAKDEAGAKCADLCRKHSVSEGAFYNWPATFGGMTVSQAKRRKTLEDEMPSSKSCWPNRCWIWLRQVQIIYEEGRLGARSSPMHQRE